ncbi:MAG: amino acid permease [Acidobacteria bacterium]|nr:amino acid permease [Acidobacteriota bacterium]
MSLPAPRTSAPRAGDLGFWTCVSLVIGNMIGSGIFLLPASLAPYGGISLVGWLISAGGSLLLAQVFCSLARRAPLAGGPYAYTRLAFGDLAGFMMAWGYWISVLAAVAAIAIAFISYLTIFFPSLASHPVQASMAALAAIWLLTAVNALGIRAGGRMQVVTTVLKILPLVALVVFGWARFDPSHFIPFNPTGQSTFSAATATVSLTLWAFLGLESATIPAGNVSDPARTIPRATLLGTVLTALLYIGTTVVVMGILDPTSLATSTAPFADAAGVLAGSWAAYAVGIGAVVSCFGALNGWILIQGQIPLALATDGLFPKVFSRVSANGTPVIGLVISSVLVTLLVAANYTRSLVQLFTFSILLATLSCLVTYLFSSLAEWTLLRQERDAPGGARKTGPVLVAILAFLYSFWAIAGSGQEAVYWGFLLLMAGVPVYVWVRRGRVVSG